MQRSWGRTRVNKQMGLCLWALAWGGKERRCLASQNLTSSASEVAFDCQDRTESKGTPAPPHQVSRGLRWQRPSRAGAVVCTRVRAGVSSLGKRRPALSGRAGYSCLSWDLGSPLGALGAWEPWFPAASTRGHFLFLLCSHLLAASYLGRAKGKLEAGLGLVWGRSSPLTDGCHGDQIVPGAGGGQRWVVGAVQG